jgi:hypothetical protein
VAQTLACGVWLGLHKIPQAEARATKICPACISEFSEDNPAVAFTLPKDYVFEAAIPRVPGRNLLALCHLAPPLLLMDFFPVGIFYKLKSNRLRASRLFH